MTFTAMRPEAWRSKGQEVSLCRGGAMHRGGFGQEGGLRRSCRTEPSAQAHPTRSSADRLNPPVRRVYGAPNVYNSS